MSGRGRGPYRYTCPGCGGQVEARQAWAARNRLPCLQCVRAANGWSCTSCGSTDPLHPYPCPEPAPAGPLLTPEQAAALRAGEPVPGSVHPVVAAAAAAGKLAGVYEYGPDSESITRITPGQQAELGRGQ